MQSLRRCSIILFVSILFSACKESLPTDGNDVQLTVNTSELIIAQNYDGYVWVTGGIGPLQVTGNSDTAIVAATISSTEVFKGVRGTSVRLRGRKLGTCSVTFQDSAKKASVVVSVTVAVMALSPNSVTYQERGSVSIFIQGGIAPYSIVQNTNSMVAEGMISGSYLYINMYTPGSAVITVQDSRSPANSASISVTVTKKPVFTTPGIVSFSSSLGEFSVNGIYVEPAPPAPPTDEGAGGWLHGSPEYMKEVEFYAYKKKENGIYDVFYVLFDKLHFSAGTLGISTRRHIPDTVYVTFIQNSNLNTGTFDRQVLTTGTVVLSAFSEQSVSGTFSGSGPLIQNQLPVPGQYFSIQNGSFTVPLIPEDYSSMTPANAEQLKIENYVRQVLRNERSNRWTERKGK
jgi:hypothetical protein